jgi:hypothetical protein
MPATATGSALTVVSTVMTGIPARLSPNAWYYLATSPPHRFLMDVVGCPILAQRAQPFRPGRAEVTIFSLHYVDSPQGTELRYLVQCNRLELQQGATNIPHREG